MDLPAELPIFLVNFLAHGTYDKLHTQLNINYGVPLLEPEKLFINQVIKTDLLPQTSLLTLDSSLLLDLC